MANIKTFDAGNLRLNPTETGVDATAKTAQRIGMFYNQQASGEDMLARETSRLAGDTSRLGSETESFGSEKGAEIADTGRRIGSSIVDAGDAAVKYLDHQQISQGAPAFANLMQSATQQWNDTVKNADPNNPMVASKFMDSMEDALTKFKEKGFYTEAGQAWAEAHVDALRQHMEEKTQADMATLAGQAAVVNQQQTINSLSSTVHSDPTSLDFSLAALKSSTEGILSASPNLSATAAGAARSEILQKGAESIVNSAALGYIEKTATVPPWATDPKYAPYINGVDLKRMESAAKTQGKANAYYDKQTALVEKQEADLKVHTAATKTLNDNMSTDPSGKLIIQPQFFRDTLNIAKNNPDAPSAAATVRTMIDFGQSQQNKEIKPEDDPVVKSDLMTRMFSADHPTTTLDVMKARAEGKISDQTFQSYHGLVEELAQSPLKGPVWQDTVEAVKSELVLSNVGLPGKDIPGEGNFAKWAQTFIPKYQAMQRTGTLPPNALDVKDPTSLISQSMAPFKRTVTQRANDYLATLGGVNPGATGTPPRNDVMPAIPSPDQRAAGSIYETPKGKMKWTGTGWVQP